MIKKVVILKPNRSLNFSESINQGVKNSVNKKIFIANDDIIISKGTLESLSEKCNRDTIVGPDSNCNLGWLTNYRYSAKNVDLVPAMSLDQVIDVIPEIYRIETYDKSNKEVSWLAFFATMIDRDTYVKDVGYMDENFIYDKEDLDWCVRASEKGKKFIYDYGSFCFHFGGVSRKKKHQELGLKHDEDQSHNENYYKEKYSKKKPIVGFYCHDAWEYWDENSINNSIHDNKPSGIGGSETQIIMLSRELSKLGYQIKIFNKCKDNHYDNNGFDVEYIPFQNFSNYSKNIVYDYFIASRLLYCFDYNFESKKNYIMIHDITINTVGRFKEDVKLDKIDKYFCLSNRHAEFVSEHHCIPKDKILITSNGLDFSRFNNKEVERDPFKLIYSSSPDRGLERLLDFFPKLDDRAHLHIFYGFENFGDQTVANRILGKIEDLNKNGKRIYYHGRVGQDRLAYEFQTSSIWAYPTWFYETFCITALEAMAGGAIVLSSSYWGLIDTVKDGGILLPMYDNPNTVYTPDYENRWIEECNRILNDSDYQNRWREAGKDRVSKFTWSNVALQWHNLFQKGEWANIQ